MLVGGRLLAQGVEAVNPLSLGPGFPGPAGANTADSHVAAGSVGAAIPVVAGATESPAPPVPASPAESLPPEVKTEGKSLVWTIYKP
jgi:hypothetical protein